MESAPRLNKEEQRAEAARAFMTWREQRQHRPR